MASGILSIRIFLSGSLAVAAGLSSVGAAPAAHPARQASISLPSGTMVAHVSWVVDDTTATDALRGWIEYLPAPDPGQSCDSIRFIQIARVQRNGGPDYDWQMGEADRNFLRTASADESVIRGGFYVDHRASACSFERPCLPYFRDSWANRAESRDGSQRGSRTVAASLVDYPFGWDTIEQISFESCARCVGTGVFLGCAEWGAKWPVVGPREILPITVRQAPSLTFLAALSRFEGFHTPAPEIRMARAEH